MPRTAALALLVGAVLLVAWRWGSFVAGGSDSACYATQAVRWAGVLRHPLTAAVQAPDPLALAAPWPDATATFTPTGHVASPTVPGAFVPICPAGLSLLMAPLYLLGGAPLMFAVVPLCGVVLVIATYVVGGRFHARVGVAAAALTAASPVFLYQVIQPMSDVPAAAFWVVAVAVATGARPAHPAWAGVATSLAVLVRPNLAPLALVIAGFLALRPERRWPVRLRTAATYAAWSAPGAVAVALIQHAFYGSPFASGYGSFAAMFATGRMLPNLGHYAAWLAATETPVIALALLAPLLLPGAMTTLLLALAGVNLLLYLPYLEFEDWSYLRFLLPAVPLLIVLAVAVIDALAVRIAGQGVDPGPPAARRRLSFVLAGVAALLAVVLVVEARRRHTFELRRMEARFAVAGRYVAGRLPPNALFITDYQSGSVPFYSGRPTLAWRSLDPAWLERALVFVRERGFEPYVLTERWEEPAFRDRFAGSPVGALDWPPVAEVASDVRVYRVADRARYREGEPVSTEYVR